MGLLDTLRAGAATAFSAAGDVPVSATLRHRATGVYDPVISESQSTITDETVSVILSRYRAFEVDGTAVKPGDQKATMLHAGLTAIPELHDEIVISGETWQIEDAKALPDAVNPILWALQLRRP